MSDRTVPYIDKDEIDSIVQFSKYFISIKDAEIARLKEALAKISKEEGKVCENFELCEHESCRSSYTSWAIATKAITKQAREK